MQAFWDWFIGEAGAGWIVGLAGLLWGLYVHFHRDRPPRVVVQEISTLRLLNVHPSQRERLLVSYVEPNGDSEQIDSLEQKELVIYNNGSKDITDPLELEFRFSEGPSEGFAGFWRLVFDDPTCTVETVLEEGENDFWMGAVVRIPYLNSFPVHHHCIKAYLISEREIDLKLAKQTGKGWSVGFMSLFQYEEVRRRIAHVSERVLFLLQCLILAGVLVLLVAAVVTEPSFRATLHPTPENVEAAIAEYTQLMNTLGTEGFVAYLSRSFPGFGYLILFCIFLLLVTPITRTLMPRIWGRIYRGRTGIQPLEKFED